MIETIELKKQRTETEELQVPDYLIRDIINGVPYYYKGYKEVLRNQKTLEEIMGSSTLQSVIISLIMKSLFMASKDDDYFILTNEVGNKLNKGEYFSLDLAIYDNAVLTSDNIDIHYSNVPPKVVVEVDIKIDLTKMSQFEYVINKSDKLLAYGTEQILWILSKTKKVLIINNSKNWHLADWSDDILLVDEHTINIEAMLKSKGIE